MNSPSKKRKKVSAIWNHFSETRPGYAVCNLCERELSCKTTVTNLRQHLKIKHPAVSINETSTSTGDSIVDNLSMSYSIVEQLNHAAENFVAVTPSVGTSQARAGASMVTSTPKPLDGSQSSDGSQMAKTPMSQQRRAEKALLRLFYKDYHSFSLVESSTFINFISALSPGYKLPSKDILLNNAIPQQYEACMRDMKRKVRSATKCCLTTDVWMSVSTDHFISVTAHFVSDQMEMEHVLLDCANIDETCHSADLAKLLQQVLKEWSLDGKVSLVVTSDSDGMKDTVVSELSLKHFTCYAHTLNTVVDSALQVMMPMIEKVKTLVSYFRANSVAAKKLAAAQKKAPNEQKHLLHDSGIGWISTFWMLHRFVELDEAIQVASVVRTESSPDPMTDEEWKVCRELVEVLKPFEEVTGQMGGDNYVPGSQVIVLTQGLLAVCAELRTMEFETIVLSVVAQLEDELRSRLPNIEFNETLALCTFLDPRFKLMAFSEDGATDNIVEQVHALLSAVSCTPSTQSSSQQSIPSSSGLSALARFKAKVTASKPAVAASASATAELQRYLDEPILELSDDPLQWWKDRQTIFPHLTKMAREKMCVVATAIPCELTFSKEGLLVADRRSKLAADKVKKLVFLNANCKA